MKNVDYDRIAREYDKHRRIGGPYVPELARLARLAAACEALELGCGTGNVSKAFLDDYPCRLFALDRSAGMIEKARAKRIAGVEWILGSALEIPLPDRCVQFVFGVFFLHHIADLAGVARECARVLSRGAVAFVTASTDYIRNQPMNRYFPSLCGIDLARFQSVGEIDDALRRAGFAETGSGQYKASPPQTIDDAFVEKVAGKYISTYELIPAEEFESGLARLRADVAAKGRLDEAVEWEWTVVWGRI